VLAIAVVAAVRWGRARNDQGLAIPPLASLRDLPTMSGMRRLVAACLVALALPALVQAASDPVLAAARKTATARSSTFQLSITTSIAGQRATMSGSGAQRGTDVKLTMRTSAAGIAIRFDAVLVQEGGGYVMYMRSPAFQAQLPNGKTWLRIDLQKEGANLGIDLSSIMS
jgi:hypothetical protein